MRVYFFSAFLLVGSLVHSDQTAPSAAVIPARENYVAKDYSHLYGMKGFSNLLLKLHFQLYNGYVKNTNIAYQRLSEISEKNDLSSPEYGALKHRVDWEWNGMRLHELYFENLGGKTPLDTGSALYEVIVRQFGSYENWKKEFVATGLMRGIGWVILYQDPQSKRLVNAWINEHDVGHLAGGSPLLVMDVFEHAYITEYGLDKGKYIEAFFANIDWKEVSNRFSK